MHVGTLGGSDTNGNVTIENDFLPFCIPWLRFYLFVEFKDKVKRSRAHYKMMNPTASIIINSS
jgi:hypothetical protein